MRTIRHGGLEVDLPGDWEDRSSLLFVAPASDASLPVGNKVEASREAITIDFTFGDGRDAKVILEERAAGLRKIDPGFEVIEQGPFECGFGEAWCYEQRLTLGEVRVRQLAVVCCVGPVAISATAAASEERFGAVRPRLEAVLRSLRASKRE